MIAVAFVIPGISCAMGKDMGMTTGKIGIDSVEFKLTEEVAMSPTETLWELGVIGLSTVTIAVVSCYLIRVLRRILKPMTQGAPFVGTVSGDIKKLRNIVIIGGLAIQWAENL